MLACNLDWLRYCSRVILLLRIPMSVSVCVAGSDLTCIDWYQFSVITYRNVLKHESSSTHRTNSTKQGLCPSLTRSLQLNYCTYRHNKTPNTASLLNYLITSLQPVRKSKDDQLLFYCYVVKTHRWSTLTRLTNEVDWAGAKGWVERLCQTGLQPPSFAAFSQGMPHRLPNWIKYTQCLPLPSLAPPCTRVACRRAAALMLLFSSAPRTAPGGLLQLVVCCWMETHIITAALWQSLPLQMSSLLLRQDAHVGIYPTIKYKSIFG